MFVHTSGIAFHNYEILRPILAGGDMAILNHPLMYEMLTNAISCIQK